MQVLHVQQRMLTVHIDLQSSLSSPSLLPGSVAAMCASTHTWSSVNDVMSHQAAGRIKPGLCHMLPTIHYYPALGSEPVTSINMAYIQMCDWCPQAVVEWIHLIHLIPNLFCPATREKNTLWELWVNENSWKTMSLKLTVKLCESEGRCRLDR